MRKLRLRGAPGGKLLCRKGLCAGKGISRRDFHIGLDPDAFPVGFGGGIDGARKRNPDREAIINAMASHRMRAAAGYFTDNRRTLQHFEIIGKFLPPEKVRCEVRTNNGTVDKRLPGT